MASERLQVILELITGQYKREAREAATATGQIGDAASKASGGTGQLSRGMAKLADTAKVAAIAAVGAGIAKFAVDSIAAASNLEESMNAVNKVFGESAEVINNFGQVSANAVGLSTREFNQLATVTGSMLTNLGFNAQQAGQETITLTQRAADMASVFNTDVGTALEAINSALKGEANPIEQFGVKLNDAAVRARAVELGLAATTAEVDANAKATATLSLIYEQTAKTQGDFASTSNDLANSQRRAAAAMENAQARFGKAVTPALANLIDRFAEGVERLAAAFGDKAAAKSIVFNEAIIALNAEMAAGTLGTEDLANSMLHLAQFTDLTAADFVTLAATIGLSEDQWGTFSADVIAQAEAMGVAPEVIAEMKKAMDDAAAAAPGAAGGIEEVGDEAGEASKKVKTMADRVKELADRLLAQSSPLFAALDSWEAYGDVLERIDEDGERTNEELFELAEQTLETNAALANLGGGNLERGIQALATALGVPRDVIIDMLKQLGILNNTTARPRVILDVVSAITGRDTATGGGSGRTYIGGKAAGGPVRGGQAYVVGERGPEIMVPSGSGTVLPNGWGGGGNVTIVVQSPMGDFHSDLQYAALIASVTNLVEGS